LQQKKLGQKVIFVYPTTGLKNFETINATEIRGLFHGLSISLLLDAVMCGNGSFVPDIM
jgi:hypothetical protein